MLHLRTTYTSQPKGLRLKWKTTRNHEPGRHIHNRDLKSIQRLISNSSFSTYQEICDALGIKRNQLQSLRDRRNTGRIRTQHKVDLLVQVRRLCGDTSIIDRHNLPAIGLSMLPTNKDHIDLQKVTIADIGAWVAYLRTGYGIQVSTLRKQAKLSNYSLPKIEGYTDPSMDWNPLMNEPLWKALTELNVTFDPFSIHKPLDLSMSGLTDLEIMCIIRERFEQTLIPLSFWSELIQIGRRSVCHLADPNYYTSLETPRIRTLALLLRIKLPYPTDLESEIFSTYSGHHSHLEWLRTNEIDDLTPQSWKTWWLNVVHGTRDEYEARAEFSDIIPHNIAYACDLFANGEVDNVIHYMIRNNLSFHDFVHSYKLWLREVHDFDLTDEIVSTLRGIRMSVEWVKATESNKIKYQTLPLPNGQKAFAGLMELKIRWVKKRHAQLESPRESEAS